ncbi:hypothetical protein [Dolichospermum circinale]|uniref:hypothetical protein n=1 Tax=Dolichospermum circinale TaxID=109265 RepID=UPI00232BD210|nr:hypothetical protein [Dolichospermum circinale]MDB9448511.1 hypothetical protein [Dolichospermum circinale CS-547]
MLVGAKHLEDKLSVIAKNSSPNASPVQLLVVSCKTVTNYQLPITNYQSPITYYLLPITYSPVSAFAISNIVLITESGLRLIESIPCSTKKRANSG